MSAAGRAPRAAWVVLVLSACASKPAVPTAAPAAQPKHVTVFLASELKGYLGPCGCSENMRGGIARAAKQIARAREGNEPVLFIDSGDSLFGEAQIPLSEIAGVRFATGDETSTTVVMLNGDSITGATDTKFITVETEWGTAKINGSSLVSMLFVPGLQWESSHGLNGKRWSLVEAKPIPTSPTRPTIPQGTVGSPAINPNKIERKAHP